MEQIEQGEKALNRLSEVFIFTHELIASHRAHFLTVVVFVPPGDTLHQQISQMLTLVC